MKILRCLLAACVLPACSTPERPDAYLSRKPFNPDTGPAATVRFDVFSSRTGNGPFVLGPRSSKLFMAMLEQPPVSSHISSMPAAPMGVFTVAGTEYLWHGNAVIHGTGRDERLWHGPFLQRLISDVAAEGYSPKDYQALLDNIEIDPNTSRTPTGGPGAYPGGSDALHPVSVEDFKTFYPR
jgi:hypothetical protein